MIRYLVIAIFFLAVFVICSVCVLLRKKLKNNMTAAEVSGSANQKRETDGLEKCEFCERWIGTSETPFVIKEHIICSQCYERIKEEKKKTFADNPA